MKLGMHLCNSPLDLVSWAIHFGGQTACGGGRWVRSLDSLQ